MTVGSAWPNICRFKKSSCEALPDGAPGPDCFDCGGFLWAFLVACPFQGTQSHEGLVQMICLCKWVIFTVGEPC